VTRDSTTFSTDWGNEGVTTVHVFADHDLPTYPPPEHVYLASQDDACLMLGEEVSMSQPTAADRANQAKIAAQLGSVGFALPGTSIERRIRCGKKGCRCGADPSQLHGPDYQWTGKVKRVTESRLLSPAQMAHYRELLRECRSTPEPHHRDRAPSLDGADSAED
jgi:hypothetical protein